MARSEEMVLSLISEERSVTTSSLLCGATAQPLVTALALVWLPIILITTISGFMVRDVSVAEERNTDFILTDNNDNLIISGVERDALAQLLRQDFNNLRY